MIASIRKPSRSASKAKVPASSWRDDHLWAENEHGLWCPNCGEHHAAPWEMDDEDFSPRLTCRACGFPEFGQ